MPMPGMPMPGMPHGMPGRPMMMPPGFPMHPGMHGMPGMPGMPGMMPMMPMFPGFQMPPGMMHPGMFPPRGPPMQTVVSAAPVLNNPPRKQHTLNMLWLFVPSDPALAANMVHFPAVSGPGALSQFNANNPSSAANQTSNLLNRHIFSNALAGLPLNIVVVKIPLDFEDGKLAKIFEVSQPAVPCLLAHMKLMVWLGLWKIDQVRASCGSHDFHSFGKRTFPAAIAVVQVCIVQRQLCSPDVTAAFMLIQTLCRLHRACVSVSCVS